MPTNRQKRTRKRKGSTYTAAMRYRLLSGDSWGTDPAFIGTAAEAEKKQKEVWEDNKSDLMSYWLQDRDAWLENYGKSFTDPTPGGFGTRPWAWWEYDAPEPLRKLQLAELVALEAKLLGNKAKLEDYENYGLLVGRKEPQYEYLRRLNLFTREEKRYFAAFKKVSHDDWNLLVFKGWDSKEGRDCWHVPYRVGMLSESGRQEHEIELGYLKKIGMAPEGEWEKGLVNF